MKTKIEIIQDLLDKRAITAQEAVTLMQKDYAYYPPVAQVYPVWQWPYYYNPISIPCTGGSWSTASTLTISSDQ